MKTQLPDKISTEAEAKTFLLLLLKNGESFHPEDDANQLANSLFSKEEGDKLNELMQQIYALNTFDPCAFILDCQYDTVIKHGELYAMGYNYSKGSSFRWSSNASEAMRLNKKDIDWFIVKKKQNKWLYELELIEK
jgi:hypothetical protein